MSQGNALVERCKREIGMLPYTAKGYSRRFASAWYKKRKRDKKAFQDVYDATFIKRLHKAGYLCSTAQRYGITEPETSSYVSDFDYRYLWPYNSSFSKWIEDIITTNRVLLEHQDVCRNVYFSIIRREGNPLILPNGGDERQNTVDDIVDCLKEHKNLELRPAFWTSPRRRYQLSYRNGKIYANNRRSSEVALKKILKQTSGIANYVIADPVNLLFDFGEGLQMEHALKLWIANDAAAEPVILSAVMNLYWDKTVYADGREKRQREQISVLFDMDRGTFTFKDREIEVSDWQKIKEKIKAVSTSMKQLSYFSMSIALQNDVPFKILHFADYPKLPRIPYHDSLNIYLKKKAEIKRATVHLTFKDHMESIHNGLFRRYVEKFCRKGIRPYMQKLWINAVKDDFLHTKGVSLKQKVWAWKRGFLSYRIWQYGLTEENYRNFLADYDYYWLNRINNNYQKWVNDKTTYRLMLEPFKEYLPRYYFSVFKRNGKTELARMWDCPANTTDDLNGLLELLRREKKLAFKPSAGTHGDGFYCLSYEDDQYTINGKVSSEQDILDLLAAQKSFYVVTEYLVMHDELQKIYPKSVNTIRVMVVNRKGCDPKIMQTYMRIGSSSTGFTDNVGYGGICVMIDKETGQMYQPETISKHVFHDCPVHPDTQTPIAGTLPHWELLRKTVLDIARYLGELEYLGFDVAITNEGLCILEINIHQDLHKVADFTYEMNDFFQRKIRNKMPAKKVRVEKKRGIGKR